MHLIYLLALFSVWNAASLGGVVVVVMVLLLWSRQQSFHRMWHYLFRIQLCFLSCETTLNDHLNFSPLTSVIVTNHGRWLLRCQKLGPMEKNLFIFHVDNNWQSGWFSSAYYTGNSLYSFHFCIKRYSEVWLCTHSF